MKGVLVSFKSKASYMMFFSIINFALYFVIQAFATEHRFDFMTSYDEAIPFMPEHIWIYHSMMPVIVVTMALLVKTKRNFFITFWSCVVAAFVLNISYLLLPAHYPRIPFEINTLSEALVDLTRQIDGANNTFPSGHVTFAWILFIGASNTKLADIFLGIKPLYLLWAIGISLSTLVLKQHYIVDVLTGVSLAYTSYFLVDSAAKRFRIFCENEPAAAADSERPAD
tara:strand:- start:1270 stop:1947 length:678 start_codon:yes stop_codon:yes gene_type:complete